MKSKGRHRDTTKASRARSGNALQRRLDAAAALLEDHGYVVLTPDEQQGVSAGRHAVLEVRTTHLLTDPDCE